ncbi:MAG: TIGR03435 family protein [Acidobacteriota bacterium]|nr:TIGR03435 family protein [Acidobacteriota bacterium]
MRTIYPSILVAVICGGLLGPACQLPPESLSDPQKESMVGGPAPGFNSGGALQILEGKDLALSSLLGQTVVFEFWATWCGPCVRIIPHWNGLVEKLSGKPISFISISADEDEDRLRGFLKTTPMRGVSAWDPDQEWFKAYQATPIPHTVIVDSAGRIAGITSPSNLTVAVLEKIMEGTPVNLPQKETIEANLEWDRTEIKWEDGIAPLTQVLIKPVSAMGTAASMYSPGSNRLVADGIFLKALIHLAFEVSPPYCDYRLFQSEQQYRVSAIVPKGQESRLLPLLRESLKSSFGLSVYWENQEKEVLVLKRLPREKSELRPSQAAKSSFWFMRGTLHGTKQTMESLCHAVAEWIGLPVIDETGLSGQYDWELPYQPGDPNVLIAALRKELGLVAEKSRRPIQVLVVENSGK